MIAGFGALGPVGGICIAIAIVSWAVNIRREAGHREYSLDDQRKMNNIEEAIKKNEKKEKEEEMEREGDDSAFKQEEGQEEVFDLDMSNYLRQEGTLLQSMASTPANVNVQALGQLRDILNKEISYAKLENDVLRKQVDVERNAIKSAQDAFKRSEQNARKEVGVKEQVSEEVGGEKATGELHKEAQETKAEHDTLDDEIKSRKKIIWDLRINHRNNQRFTRACNIQIKAVDSIITTFNSHKAEKAREGNIRGSISKLIVMFRDKHDLWDRRRWLEQDESRNAALADEDVRAEKVDTETVEREAAAAEQQR